MAHLVKLAIRESPKFSPRNSSAGLMNK